MNSAASRARTDQPELSTPASDRGPKRLWAKPRTRHRPVMLNFSVCVQGPELPLLQFSVCPLGDSISAPVALADTLQNVWAKKLQPSGESQHSMHLRGGEGVNYGIVLNIYKYIFIEERKRCPLEVALMGFHILNSV